MTKNQIYQLDKAINVADLSVEDLRKYVIHLSDVLDQKQIKRKKISYEIGDVLYYDDKGGGEAYIIKVNEINTNDGLIVADTITIDTDEKMARLIPGDHWYIDTIEFKEARFKKINVDWDRLEDIMIDLQTRLDHLYVEKINDIRSIIDINN